MVSYRWQPGVALLNIGQTEHELHRPTECLRRHLLAVLRTGFETEASDDAPIDPELLDRVRAALTEASATALPGLPVVVRWDRRMNCMHWRRVSRPAVNVMPA